MKGPPGRGEAEATAPYSRNMRVQVWCRDASDGVVSELDDVHNGTALQLLWYSSHENGIETWRRHPKEL